MKNAVRARHKVARAAARGATGQPRVRGGIVIWIKGDTVQFSVNSIRRWLDVMGRERYPHAGRLMITADGGGSNGSRTRLFKVEKQKLAGMA